MPVQIRSIGSQGLKASNLGYGAMGLTVLYGPPTPDNECMKVLKRCLDLGVNMIDTAEVYRTDAKKLAFVQNHTREEATRHSVKDNDEKPITNEEESDFKVSIREEFDDENDIKITVKEDSYISESKPDIEPEEIPKYKFPTF